MVHDSTVPPIAESAPLLRAAPRGAVLICVRVLAPTGGAAWGCICLSLQMSPPDPNEDEPDGAEEEGYEE